MRTLLIVTFFTLFSLNIQAQSNLKFSQVLTFNGNLSTFNIPAFSPIYTVPQNKVWKIEAKSPSGGSDGLTLIINGLPYKNIIGTFYNSAVISSETIWLKAGDEIKYQLFLNSINISGSYFISIIEYSISP